MKLYEEKKELISALFDDSMDALLFEMKNIVHQTPLAIGIGLSLCNKIHRNPACDPKGS